MARDAETNSADDRKKKEEIEARNRADAMIYNVDKMLKEHRDKISETDAKQVEAALEDVRKAMSEGGLEKINSATDKLTQASHKLAEAMYKSENAGQNGAGPDLAQASTAQGRREPNRRSPKTTLWTRSSWTSKTRSKNAVAAASCSLGTANGLSPDFLTDGGGSAWLSRRLIRMARGKSVPCAWV